MTARMIVLLALLIVELFTATPSTAQQNDRASVVLTLPENVAVLHTQTVVLSCAAYGTPTPSISWSTTSNRNLSFSSPSIGVNITHTIKNITNTLFAVSVLKLCNVSSSDAGNYSCIANNGVAGCGLASNVSSTPLNIYSSIAEAVSFNITSHGVSIINSSINLTCSIKSQVEVQQPLVVLLRGPNGHMISNTSTNFTSGHNSLTAEIDLTVASMVGKYTCKLSALSNGVNISADDSFTVTVPIPDPMVTIIPDNVTRFEGENFKLTCKATHSQVNTPVEISFMWYYLNTQIISNDEMYSISSNNSESQLIIKQLQSQGNVYKCIAIFLSSTDPTIYLSSNNSDVYDISIDVSYSSPSDVIMLVQDGLTTLNETDKLQISCSSYGFPPPLIYWKRNNHAIVEGSRITISTFFPSKNVHQTPVNSTLQISNLLPSDGGVYVCVASNVEETKENSSNITVNSIDDCTDTACGSHGVCVNLASFNSFLCNCSEGYFGVPCTMPNPTRLNVVKIVKSPVNTNANLYELVSLTCMVTGDQPIVYQWERDGNILPNRKLSYLIIPEVNPEDRGVYRCLVNNSISSAISQPGLLTIKGIAQYELNATITNISVEVLVNALIGPLANDIEKSSYYNVTVISVEVSKEMNGTWVSLLVTVLNQDARIDSSNFRTKLDNSLNQLHSSLPVMLLDVNSTNVHDACPSQTIYFRDTKIEIKWNETMISQTAKHPCPCQSLTKVSITRVCEGSYSQGAKWTEMSITQCNMTMNSLKLCEASLLNQPPQQLSEILVNATSVPGTLLASEVTVAAVVIKKLTEAAAANISVRENYLTSIDNIIEVDEETIKQARASTSILKSLSLFSTTVQANFTDNMPLTFAQTNFAIQIQQIDVTKFAGETFNVDLGSVGEAMNASGNINPEALRTLLNPLSNATGSLSVSEEAVKNSNGSFRLGYSVFISSSLFPTESENTTIASIILNLVMPESVNHNVENKTSNVIDDLFNVTFQAILPPKNTAIINETCANWDFSGDDGFGRWTSEACDIISEPGERPVRCKCSQPAHFGLLFDLAPSTPLIPEALHAITHIFLPLSMISLLTIIITYLADKHLRSQPHDQIIINLSISLLGLYSFFLLGGHVTRIKPLCGISAGLLHYFMLVFFSWTAVESVFLFVKLVKVMGTGISHYTLKAGLLAWIVPAFIVIIVGGAGYQYYTNPFFCRADKIPFYIGTIVPIVLIFCFNWIMYIIIMVSICRRLHSAAKITNTDLSLRQLARTAVVLSVVLGLGWAFGLLQTSVPEDSTSAAMITLTVFQVLFSLLVGLQGVLMFGFYGIGNKKVREVWKKWFCWRKNKIMIVNLFSRSTASTSETMKTGISGNTGTSINDYSEVPEKSGIFSAVELNEEIKLTECATYGNLQEAKKLSDKANDANYEQIDVDIKNEMDCCDYEEPVSIGDKRQEKVTTM